LGIPDITSIKNKAKYSFIDQIVKTKNKDLGNSPVKYQKIETWCAPGENGANRPNGSFLKSPRITISDRIFHDEKR
jgi:hypothetical protein